MNPGRYMDVVAVFSPSPKKRIDATKACTPIIKCNPNCSSFPDSFVEYHAAIANWAIASIRNINSAVLLLFIMLPYSSLFE
ncbi:hypothetical protein [Methanolobus sp. ZRKC5]|uniref:hypothetical protein n=1 Tax=unclassified Methanolobus TaxID=2629569 RepID=UPI00313E6F06